MALRGPQQEPTTPMFNTWVIKELKNESSHQLNEHAHEG